MNEVVLATALEYNKAETEFRSARKLTVKPAPVEEQLLAEAVLKHNCRGVGHDGAGGTCGGRTLRSLPVSLNYLPMKFRQ